MASLQSHLIRFVLHRINIFGGDNKSLPEIRRRAESGTRWLRTPSGVSLQPVRAGGVAAEWLIPRGAPADRVLLYIHGGGFAICSPNTHRPMVSRLAMASGSRALSLDYRLAPEHPFPAAVEDCLAAYRWLLENDVDPGRIVVAGDSAGGNLALVLLVALRQAGDPLPAGAVALSPVTDLAWTGESLRTKAQVDPMLSSPTPGRMVEAYIGDHDPTNPLLSPLYADLRGLPPLLLHVGEDEILLDDATRLVERARAAGVEAQVVVWPRMWHVFQIFAPFLPEARESIEQIGRFVRERQN